MINHRTGSNKMRGIYFIVFLMFISNQACIWAQMPVLLHLDRPHYLPGQIVYYSLSTSHQIQDTCILGVQLTQNLKKIDQHYVLWIDGYAFGYFQLPFGIPAGNYIIQADVFKRSGEAINILNAAFTVLSPSILPGETPKAVAFNSPFNNDEIEIDLEGGFQVREFLKCTVRVDDGQLNDRISISIKEKSFYAQASVHRQEVLAPQEPLLKMIPIQGKRIFQNEKPKEDAFLFVADPHDLSFSFNWVDANGDFNIRFPTFYGKNQLFFIDNGGNNVDVSVAPAPDAPIPTISMTASPEATLSISAYNERKKIYQLYSSLEETIVSQSLPVVDAPPADYDIDVQDFSVRGKLVDLLKEIITPLKFRKTKGDRYIAKVLYEVLGLKYFYDSDPLFFINGSATRDFDYLANLPLQDVKSLKLYATLETVRSLKLVDIGGVGVIEMVDPLFSIPQEIKLPGFELQGLQIPINYPVMVDINSPIPQLRSLLFWQPDEKLDANGNFVIEIPCSDDISVFEIEVVHHPSQSVQHTQMRVQYHD